MKNILIIHQPVLDIVIKKSDYISIDTLKKVFKEIITNSVYYQKLIKNKFKMVLSGNEFPMVASFPANRLIIFEFRYTIQIKQKLKEHKYNNIIPHQKYKKSVFKNFKRF